MPASLLEIIPPSIGEVIGRKYRLTRKLGEGGMGVVFEAHHLRLDQRVAIKILLPNRATGEHAARFEREARAACRLTSPHAVRVFDVDETEEGLPFMVMELLSGIELGAELAARKRMSIAEAIEIIVQACSGLTEAHAAGIVHRDLKPSNLFLADVDGARVVKVLDFGISKLALDERALTTTGAMLGTPLYMSPEQTRGARDVDARTDVWALGVILYRMIAGAHPFPGPGASATVAQIVADAPRPIAVACPEVSLELEAVILKALAKDANARFPDVVSLARALEALVRPRAPEHTTASIRIPRRPRSARVLLVVGGVALAGGIAGAAAMYPRDAARVSDTPTGPPAPASFEPRKTVAHEAASTPSTSSRPTTPPPATTSGRFPRATATATATERKPPPPATAHGVNPDRL